ncbi:ABC-2 type transport system permease protein [Paramicrobacterium humi]|uniref:ABC-2 type transport system permease protein n=1 Tax=Paramicrobacterium humi TaxID=640635 RepID=A0A1H4JVN0_9MICO|nr:hypothetical protein [Microbacterium humi]SEB49888.1 ABC-2 type transport system permease protein [Microbacterium humi]
MTRVAQPPLAGRHVTPAAVRPAASVVSTAVGTGTMLRFVLRRNWLRMLIWIIVLAGMVPLVYSSQQEAFPTQAARDAYAQVANTPSVAALTGLPYAAGSLGGILVIKLWMTLAVGMAFAVVFLVTRNGRADEEAGRTELLRAGVLGRHAPTLATAAATAAFSAVMGLAITALALACGLDGGGSWTLGASIAGTGIAFTGVALLCGQLTQTSRAANALGSVIIALAYLVRAIADVGATDATPHPLSWASPIGWAQNMRAYGDENWWPFALLVALGAIGCCAALAIESRRDLGAGVLPQRPGRARAGAVLGSPLGLLTRLLIGPMIGWLVGATLFGAFFGGVALKMVDVLEPGSAYAIAFAGRGDPLAGILGLFSMVNGMLAGGFAVQAVCAARIEEANGRLEAQLATALSRTRWLGAPIVLALVWSALMLTCSGAALAGSYGKAGAFGELVAASLSYLPACVVLIGIAVFTLGWLPRLSITISWALYGAFVVVAMFGPLLRVPDDVVNTTIFAATPRLPADDPQATPLIVLNLVGIVLAALGLWRFRRRDIPA